MSTGPTDQHWRQGRRRLRAMLRSARVEAAGIGDIQGASGLFEAMRPYVTLDNLDALLLYPAPLGGWHADLVLCRTPPSVPNTVGSPVANPHRTLPEAELAAQRLLAMACRIAQQNNEERMRSGAAKEARGAFLLFDYVVPLQPDVIETFQAAYPGVSVAYVSKERAIECIEAVLDRHLPGDRTGKGFAALPHEHKADVLVTLHRAAAGGVFAYPPRRDASPSGHREQASGARH